jgi:outer membrane protein OmpA-like peptidoglycan-associated protein
MSKLTPMAAMLAAVVISTALNAEPVYVGAGQTLRPIDVARALAGKNFQPKMRMRGMDLGGNAAEPLALGANTAPAASQPAPNAAAQTQSTAPSGEGLAVAIAFAFDSATLAPAAYPLLDNLAEGIKLTDPSTTVQIEGHTDAVGTDAYNLLLSERRANAVRDYLIQHHGIAAARLRSSGKGETSPLTPKAPNDAKNRRVEFALG